MPVDYSQVVGSLERVSKTRWGWKARCPAHEDRRESLTVRIAPRTGDLLLKCHAGCSFDEITGALGIDWKACTTRKDRAMKEVAHYDYKDETGKLLYQVVRFEPKDFRQRVPDGSGWKWGLNGSRRVLYRLPELLASEPRSVLIVEGEKDVDRLYREGLIGTCNPMGAGKWIDEYSVCLKGRTCIVIPDKDKPGEEHIQMVLRSLAGQAKKAAPLRLEAKDVSEWFDAGHRAEELVKLCKAALVSDVKLVLDSARKLDRRSKWMAVRELIADLEADET